MKYHLLFLVIVCFIHCPISTWGQINDSLLFSEKSANYNVIHLLDSTSVEVNENGAGTFHIHRITKILKTAGALSHRVIKFDYDPLTAFAEFKYVKIKQANGKTRFIAPKTACDYVAPARAIYWGARQIMIEPGRLEPGDTIEYEISKKGFTYALLNASEDEERFIPPMKGQFYDIIPFWNSEPVLKKV